MMAGRILVCKAVEALAPGTEFTAADLLVMMGTKSPTTPTRTQIASALRACPFAVNTTPGVKPAIWRRVRCHPPSWWT